MTILDGLQIILYIAALCILTPILGRYIAFIYAAPLSSNGIFGKFETTIYRICSIKPSQEMNWTDYARALLGFNALGILIVFTLQVCQAYLPLNPARFPNVSWHAALNTAISFVTNTNWQSYSGENSMSHLTQMLGLGTQNFLSAATGIAVLFVLIRAFTRKETQLLGNFWVDLVRCTLYILLPLSLCMSIVLVAEGTVQNFNGPVHVRTVEGRTQTIPQGPAASQIAIKQLGTNGGGFFNTNSAHPYENPTPVSNFLQMLALLLIPSALVWMYGKAIGNIKHGRVIWAVMLTLWVSGFGLALYSETHLLPQATGYAGWEGKELRIGIPNSVLWATATTAASNGSVNAMISSMSPLTGGIALFNILLGEIVFGGVGSGLYGMLLFVLLTLFLAGLMVGRTPEYLGKKLGGFEMKMAVLGLLLPNILILCTIMAAILSHAGLAGPLHTGPHGFSEMLYAFASSAGNNGSAFAGINAGTPFYNITTGIAMLCGRFGIIIPCLAIAGNLVRHRITPASSGSLPTDTMVFGALLISVILLFAGLTFFPALCLGPIVEHLLMTQGVWL